MADALNEAGNQFSPLVGLIFIFNLIVGTGALTMPRAFDSAGWLLSLILVIALAFTSYLTATFVIEAMALANAMLRWKKQIADEAANRERNDSREASRNHEDEDDDLIHQEEHRPLLEPARVDEVRRVLAANDEHLFDITQRVEMGQMASLFFHPFGVKVFYVCICVYLYGDLAIYAAAVPKSLRDVACTWTAPNGTDIQDSDLCWESSKDISRSDAYRLFLAAFTVCLGVFVFFNVQKTKYLQIFTTIMRWIAFISMITLASIRLAAGKGEGHPKVANISGIPTLFGVCVYSFMCHHSLPSLATPIRNKNALFGLFAGDYALILGFYAVLSFTGIFCFENIEDLYTLNFKPGSVISNCLPLEYFLALFPVFTLSTNFPIIGITLRNNLKTMFAGVTCPPTRFTDLPTRSANYDSGCDGYPADPLPSPPRPSSLSGSGSYSAARPSSSHRPSESGACNAALPPPRPSSLSGSGSYNGSHNGSHNAALTSPLSPSPSPSPAPYPWIVDRIVFPLATLTPPVAIAFATHDVEVLVGVTGSYAGAAIQYVVPAALAYCGRRSVLRTLGADARNPHTSPFRHAAWIVAVLVWATVAIVFVTVNHIIERK